MTDFKEIELVFLIADLSGYTALTEAHGGMSAAKIVTRYVALVEEAIQPGLRLNERVGDEVMIVSPNAGSVVRTAIKLKKSTENEALFPTLHGGIHAGTVVEKGGHYFGTSLNLASRVASHAGGNQILCTQRVIDLAGDLEEVNYRTLGAVHFKNIANPIEVFEVVTEEERIEGTFIDPVCRMQVRKRTAPAKLPFEGITYYFCSFECTKAFAENPERYRKEDVN